MRIVEVSEKLIGEKMGKDIYTDTGRLLLGRGVVLNNILIKKLLNGDIYFVYIDDEFSEGIEIKGIIDDHVMMKSINKVKNILTNVVRKNKGSVSNMVNDEDINSVQDVVSSLINALEESENALYTVVELMGTDMYTYKHSVNVTILTILTCKSLGYNFDITKKIALGALLHDIGKSVVGEDLITKKEKLTSEEQTKIFSHAEFGYDLIKDDIALSGYTKQIVRLHHEKRDGSGYPLKLKEAQIPEFVRIVTICDIFDAMTSDRSYRSKMPVYEAIEVLMADAVFKLDSVILKVFLKNICVYPPGTGVILKDNRHAIVFRYNKSNPTRPVLKVYNKMENGILEVEELDLEIHRTLFIENTIDTEIIKELYSPAKKNTF